MSEPMLIAIINLVARVGFDAAIAVLGRLKGAATLDDAIAALEASRAKTWTDYKAAAPRPPSG